MIELFVIALLAYLIGSIPSGYLIARYRGVEDIRAFGSGNIGATNVARALGTKYFFLVFFCDFIKSYAFLRALSTSGYSQSTLILSGVALLIGNAASLFLQFRGGKGVATSFGIFLALAPQLALAVFAVWASVLMLAKTVGLASIAGLIFLPIAAWFLATNGSLFAFAFFASVLGLFLHRDNIRSYYGNFFNKSAI